MVINLAEGTQNIDIRIRLEDETRIRQKDPFRLTLAFSIVNSRNVWLREFQLQKGVSAVVGSLIHEAARLAGAPNDYLADYALDIIHHAAGYPR